MLRHAPLTWIRLSTLFSKLSRAALAAALLFGLGMATVGAGHTTSADGCQTGFIVFTDPANPGARSDHGRTTIIRDSGVLGSYLDGRLAGYSIAGLQDIEINGVTNKAQLQGSFTATSPDSTSSLTLRYAGHANLNTGEATGTFVVKGGTGEFADYHTNGKIAAQLVGPATFQGVDIGLC